MDPTAGIAWEAKDRTFFDRLWSTVRDATIDPIHTFKATGIPGETGDAVRFALVSSLVGYFPMLMCVPCLGIFVVTMAGAILSDPHVPEVARGLGAGALCSVIAFIPLFVVLFSLFVEATYAVLFHLFSKMAGGQGSFAASTRAMLYTSAIRFWLPVPLVLGWIPIPFIGLFLHWGGRALMILWSGFACYGAALGVHRLEGDRAVFVGIATPVVAVFIHVAGFAATIAAIVSLLFGGLGVLGTLLPH